MSTDPKRPWQLILRVPFQGSNHAGDKSDRSNSEDENHVDESSEAISMKTVAFSRRSCPIEFERDVAMRRSKVVEGEVETWPCELLFWALLDSSHNLLPQGHVARVSF